MSKRRSRGSPTTPGTAIVVLFLAGLVWLLNRLAGETPASEGWYALYFTSPEAYSSSADFHGGTEERLIESVQSARQTIDLAGYEINLENLAVALAAAHGRGVRVRAVTDSDNLEEDAVRTLEQAGIEVIGDRREALMHDKFMVVDGEIVWTGSMNFTVNDVYRNNNNFLQVQSRELAQDYAREFEEMFTEEQFGPRSPADTPRPFVAIGGTEVEVLFSPEDNPARRIVELIREAQSSIRFLAFSFTSDEIAEAMLERAETGVTVQGVMERSQYESNQGTELDRLNVNQNIEVRLDANPHNLHHKVIVIDGGTVITGSYNFSRAAEESNDENVLILHSAEIAAQYLAEFEKLFEMAK